MLDCGISAQHLNDTTREMVEMDVLPQSVLDTQPPSCAESASLLANVSAVAGSTDDVSVDGQTTTQ